MRAVVITRPGGPEVLEVQNVEDAGANRRSGACTCTCGRVEPRRPLTTHGSLPGSCWLSCRHSRYGSFAGEIDAVGPLARNSQKGQRVMGLLGGGGQAEYVLVHEGLLVAIPDNLDFVQAAAIPEVFMTAHDALFTQAGLQMGERVLIHAAGSGVGTAGYSTRARRWCHHLWHIAYTRQTRTRQTTWITRRSLRQKFC